MSQPDHRVTVVIPLYNSASTLSRAAWSVLRQTLRAIDLLIIDDGSKDNSLAEALAIAAADTRVRVISLPENRGKSHVMNRAIAQATGDWVAVLDADDWYEPERLATLVEAGEAHGVSLVADNQRFWDAGADVVVRTAFPDEQGDKVLTRHEFIAGSDPCAAFDFGMLKPIIRAECIRRLSLAYRDNARLSEDFLYLADFFSAGETALLIARPLYNWTQPFGSISRQWTLTGAGDWRYDYRSAVASHADALQGLLARRDQPMADLIVSRMRAFERLNLLTALSRMRRSGVGLPRILLEVARHPSIWGMLATRVVGVS